MGKKMKKAIWLSYDLGVQGDYDGLYTWLDGRNAKDCGDNIAFFNYHFPISVSEDASELLENLTNEIKSAIKVTSRSRIYVIYSEPQTKKIKGSFIMGGRKSPPWSGYAQKKSVDDTEE